MSQFINSGLENYVALEKIIAVFSNKSAPIKALIAKAKQEGTCFDLTFGRACRCVILTTENQLILSPTKAKTIVGKVYPHVLAENSESNEMIDLDFLSGNETENETE